MFVFVCVAVGQTWLHICYSFFPDTFGAHQGSHGRKTNLICNPICNPCPRIHNPYAPFVNVYLTICKRCPRICKICTGFVIRFHRFYTAGNAVGRSYPNSTYRLPKGWIPNYGFHPMKNIRSWGHKLDKGLGLTNRAQIVNVRARFTNQIQYQINFFDSGAQTFILEETGLTDRCVSSSRPKPDLKQQGWICALRACDAIEQWRKRQRWTETGGFVKGMRYRGD